MTTDTVNKPHQKHAKLAHTNAGEWGRNELALMGAPCSVIKAFVAKLTKHLSPKLQVAFVDAEHNVDEIPDQANFTFTKTTGGTQIAFSKNIDRYQQHFLFNDQDLILVNGNHFGAQQQVVFIDDSKPLDSKLERLTNVLLVLKKNQQAAIPGFLKPYIDGKPVLLLDDISSIKTFFENYLEQQIAPLNGLVLAGGKSERMGSDKSLLSYNGTAQRDRVLAMLQPLCSEVFVSCNATQSLEITGPKIEDRFLGIGPMGGILSAFQNAPNSAWLTLACDLPYLTDKTLTYLVTHRNPSKLATAFMDPEGKFPEPLITIWEPRAYPVLLQALSEGLSCPRKVLINTDVEILQAPDVNELQNINDYTGFLAAKKQFGQTDVS